MKRFPLLLLSAAALFINACEQHPLPGESPASGEPSKGEQHPGGRAPDPKEHRDDPSQPSKAAEDAPKAATPGEPPKYFPEQK